MDHRIIKYYAGELSKEERKALLQEAFSNQELKKEMINCQHLQSLVKLHPQEKNELSGKESIIRKTKCFDFWERNVLFPKTKRSFFRTPTPSTLPFSA